VTVPSATIAELGLPANFADAIPFRQDVRFFIGKVDWQLGSNHRLAMRYSGHRNNSPYNNSTTADSFCFRDISSSWTGRMPARFSW
jgi:hypothetical protein